MKIAATYDISTDSIFQHFGKTQNFKVYTIEDGKIADSKVIDNGGFGHHDLATYLKNLGIETLILGNRGQGAIGAMPKLEICKNGNRRNAETGKLKKTAIGTMPKQIN